MLQIYQWYAQNLLAARCILPNVLGLLTVMFFFRPNQLPLLTLTPSSHKLEAWGQHCVCTKAPQAFEWDNRIGWTCPVEPTDTTLTECGRSGNCVDAAGNLLAMFCPEGFYFENCRCHWRIAELELQREHNKNSEHLFATNLEALPNYCSMACVSDQPIRRLESDGYACIMNTTAPHYLRKLCFSGCVTSTQNYLEGAETNYLDAFSGADITEADSRLVFLCPFVTGACGAGKQCIEFEDSDYRSYSYILLDNIPSDSSEPYFVVADTFNTRQLLGDGNHHAQTSCVGRLPTSCTNMTATSDELSHCECRVSPRVTTYIHMMLETGLRHLEMKRKHQGTKDFSGLRVLSIGFGSGALSTLTSYLPGVSVETVDTNSYIPRIGKAYFGFPPGLYHEKADCLEAVQSRVQQGIEYDLIYLDAFYVDGRVPETCRGKEITNGMSLLLRSRHGVVIQNIWDSPSLIQEWSQTWSYYESSFTGAEGLSYEHFSEGREHHQTLIKAHF